MEPHQRRARDRAGFGDDTEQGSQTRRAVLGPECQRQAGQGDSRTNIEHPGIRACRSAHVLRAQTDAVLPDEFPLSMFYEALSRKLSPVVTSTAGITG